MTRTWIIAALFMLPARDTTTLIGEPGAAGAVGAIGPTGPSGAFVGALAAGDGLSVDAGSISFTGSLAKPLAIHGAAAGGFALMLQGNGVHALTVSGATILDPNAGLILPLYPATGATGSTGDMTICCTGIRDVAIQGACETNGADHVYYSQPADNCPPIALFLGGGRVQGWRCMCAQPGGAPSGTCNVTATCLKSSAMSY
jgi:hypothetical protein